MAHVDTGRKTGPATIRSARANGSTAQVALRRMAEAEPELAARLIIQSLPAAAAGLPDSLSYGLKVEGLGSFRVQADGRGGATVEPLDGQLVDTAAGNGAPALDGQVDFVIETDPRTLARIASGHSPVGSMLRGKVRLRGRRRKALALRKLSEEASVREVARMGAPIDPDIVFRGLAYAIEPEWTAGHRFCVAYELSGEGGGTWYVQVDDGSVRVSREPPPGGADATGRTSVGAWLALLRGELTPAAAMEQGHTRVDGELYPVTLLGRWIDRAEGVDGPELEREQRQRELQRRRAGAWGSQVKSTTAGQGDPAHESEGKRRSGGGLLSYQELYALWERQNWRAHELDFELDKEHWLATPTEAQEHTAWSLGSFYAGEERVAADLAPFVLAAPSGEVEIFLTTQLVDEARHAAFFDRWAAEVMALSAEEMRGRLEQVEGTMMSAWHFLFDDSLRDVANRIKQRPDDLELFVEGIVTYHMVTEGVLAMTGQRVILQYTADHNIYPGFNRGFSLVEQDEHRHIAFGVRFLKDVCEERPEMRAVVERTLERLLPETLYVFVPPDAHGNAEDFISYDYHSSQVYGHAYNALKRRMNVIGIEIPPPEKLMPGPIDPSGLENPGSYRPAALA